MTTFTGTSGNDVLPLAGLDNSADDILYGLAGNDTLYGGAANDLLVGGTGVDTQYGGAGVDTASYAGAAGTMTVNLTTGLAVGSDAPVAGEHLYEVENLVGSAYRDLLYGNAGANSLAGGDGNDLLQGYAGNDTLQGGNGDDTLNGGLGIDTVSYSTSSIGVRIRLYDGTSDGYDDNTTNDRLIGFENAIGSAFHDGVSGDAGANVLDGGAGDDSMWGCEGKDNLIGGEGQDTFVYYTASETGPSSEQCDVIRDFSQDSHDRIGLFLDADVTAYGHQDFTFLGNDVAFTGAAGQLTFASGGLQGDTNGDRVADFSIQLNGVTTMSESDFLL